MKKITTLIKLAMLGTSTANAGVYIGADIGYSKIHTGNISYTEKLDSTYGVTDSANKHKNLETAKLGYSSDFGLRTEIALTRYGNTKNSYVDVINGTTIAKVDFNRSLKSRSLMVNAYYDFNTTSPLQPYVMAGTGLAINKTGFELSLSNADFDITKSYNSNSTKNALSYQVGAGASYKITNRLYANAGMKYAYVGKSSTDGAIISQSAKISNVDTTIGVRYSL